jgi:hypothetical protein
MLCHSNKNLRCNYFTLLEVIIASGILAFFMYLCSNTLVSTLTMKIDLEEMYSKNKIKSMGWHIIYQDLANAVGIYYLDGTDWAGIPKQDKKNDKSKKEKKKGPKVMTIDLFEYYSEPDAGEPFLRLIVSKGRMGVASDPGTLGFRLVEYYIDNSPVEGADGMAIFRVESLWREGGDDDEEEEEVDFLGNYRKYIVIENIRNVSHAVYSGTEWVDEWNSTQIGDLPIALKISYTDVEDEESDIYKEEIEDERVIPLPISYQIVDEPVDDAF